MKILKYAALAAALCTLVGCAHGAGVASGPPPSAPGNACVSRQECSQAPGSLTAARMAIVPDVSGETLDAAKDRLQQVKLVPVVRYAPEILVDTGSVMLSVPKAGASAAAGDVVILVVAGRPKQVSEGSPGAQALSQLAAEREDVFVGVGYAEGDASKPMVVALQPGVDQLAWQDRLAAAAGGQKYTVRTCANTLEELRRIKTELLPADLMPRAGQITFSAFLAPAECAVHVTGNFHADEVTALRERYGPAVTVQRTR